MSAFEFIFVVAFEFEFVFVFEYVLVFVFVCTRFQMEDSHQCTLHSVNSRKAAANSTLIFSSWHFLGQAGIKQTHFFCLNTKIVK